MDNIAKRTFSIRASDIEVEGSIAIGKPTPSGSEGDWTCCYVLEINGRLYEHTCIGIDSLQALQLALTTSDVELRARIQKLDGVLLFLGEPASSLFDGGGFGKGILWKFYDQQTVQVRSDLCGPTP